MNMHIYMGRSFDKTMNGNSAPYRGTPSGMIKRFRAEVLRRFMGISAEGS